MAPDGRMTDLADLPFDQGAGSPAIPTKPRPHRHVWVRWMIDEDGVKTTRIVCEAHAVPVVRDEAKARRGKQSRNYGNRAELAVARQYGGTKIGHAGGPVDVRGEMFNTQIKTHRRKPPIEWTNAFAAMAASRERLPRLLLRFVQGGGRPAIDFIVVPGEVWLEWYGRDEPPGEAP